MIETTERGYRIRTGEKYRPDIDAKRIAQFIRQDIANAKRDGKIPRALHTTVRVRNYTYGCSIDIAVRRLPSDAPTFTSNVAAQYSGYGRSITDPLRPIYEAYQRTVDDCPGDYRSNNFIGFVLWELVRS